MKYLEKLYVFTSFIAIEQIQRWKYKVEFSFPNSIEFRKKSYAEKYNFFLDYLKNLTTLHMWIYKNQRFLYVWFAEKIESKENEYNEYYIFHLFVAHNFELEKEFFIEGWYKDCVSIFFIEEWNFYFYKYDWDIGAYTRIYKKIYDISEQKYNSIIFLLRGICERKYIGYSFDFGIVMENMYVYIYYYLFVLLDLVKYILIDPLNLEFLFKWNFFNRW